MPGFTKRLVRPSSFTLIELLVVMAIIAILAGLVLYAFSGVQKSAARSRARSEISALSAAMESYKVDNGTYPIPTAPIFNSTNDYATAIPSTPQGLYQLSSEFLYQSLTGQTNYGDPPPNTATGARIYYTFQKSQLGNNSAGAGPVYIQDPFGYSYGYYSTTNNAPNPPNNGGGLFDLWSTGGNTTSVTNSWIDNW